MAKVPAMSPLLPLYAFKHGRRWRPDVVLVECDGRQEVWKDYRHLAGWRAPVGRWLAARERAFLARLPAGGPTLAPAPLGVVAMARVEGRPLQPGDAQALALLEAFVLDLHVRGVAHNDIHRSNVLVTAEGRPVLLDFGAALGAPPGLRWLLRPLQRRDLQHVRKMQAVVGQGQPAAPNPWWVRAAQQGWNRLRGKRPGDAEPQQGG